MMVRFPVLGIFLGGLIAQSVIAAEQSPVDVWATFLKPKYFADKVLIEDTTVIEMKTPYRAEDAAFTPVTIRAQFPQTAERFIEKIYLVVDNNPEPLAGVFNLTPEIGRADLALRIRIDNYTNVRAIAVLNSGEHHIVSNFVKAQGGCSAPLGSDLQAAMERIGQINFRTVGERTPEDAIIGQLMLSHPNITGMQKDQKTQLIRPAHFVKSWKLYFNDALIMTAETGISISEDPSFRFFFKPHKGGELKADVIDSQGKEWTKAFKVEA
ncbi:MAG: quinoprotein dehydrogenase-associated SoxYZ-like carrier [Gammaproteobacteria bacterium]|nr:quinoprotein dehydrogenase-associated SoxYZ-like carrier [Gammaproteobacteria bacterium]